MTDYTQIRQTMVDSQIKTVKVTDDRIIEALRKTPREDFLPEHLKSIAYVDEDLRIKGDRYMTEPMVLARLLQAAEVSVSDAALVVGCTMGYAVALMSTLADTVVGVEDDAEFVAQADKNLSARGIDNAAVVECPLHEGYKRQAPYDVILIEGRCGQVPDGMIEQLALGGRLVTLTDDLGVGKAILMRRSAGGAVGTRVLFDASVPPLRSFAREPKFQL